MPITVRELLGLSGLGLTLVAGERGLDRAVTWAHISELHDPTPWLSGGELLLTTGMDLETTASAQREYLKRLVGAHLSGLGFGVGFNYNSVPPTLRSAADREGFPILEVPYPVPFIAITKAISSRLAEDRLREAQSSLEIHERLAALVSEGAGPADLLEEVVGLAVGWAVLFDLKGDVLAAAASGPISLPDPTEVWAGLPPGLRERRGPRTASEAAPRATRVALAVLAGKRREAVLVFGKQGRLDQRDRIVVHHAVSALGLLLASRRAVIEAERRIAGDLLSDAFAGRLTGPDLQRRLGLAGFPEDERVTVLVVEPPEGLDHDTLDELQWSVDASLGPRSTAARTALESGRIAAAVVHRDPHALAHTLETDLASIGPELGVLDGFRIGVGESSEPSSIRHSHLSAVLALRAAPERQAIASQRDLGSYGFLLGAQPRPALEGFVRSVLGPLIERDHSRSSELVRSVRAFIEAGGRWEQGAESLGVHRHTLRYRVRQAEELLARDLSNAEDRLEVWLALKAAEILDE